MCRADFIVFCLLTLSMVRTINLHDQSPVKANKINYIIIYNVLTPEVHSHLLPS